MTRTTGGPWTAITEAIVEGGGSASKRDAPPQAWTIPAVPPTSGRRCGSTCTPDWAGKDGVCVCVSDLRLQLGYCKCMRYQSLVPSR
jgi:hypothetical protein